jgi:hypothetical protein
MEADTLARAVSGFKGQGPIAKSAVDAVAGRPLGGHLGIGLPFTGEQAVFDLTTPLSYAAKIPGVGTAMDKADTAWRYTRSLFDKPARQQTNPVMQAAARTSENALRDIQYTERAKSAQMADWFQRKLGWKPEMDWERGLSDMTDPLTGLPLTFKKANDLLGEQLVRAVERTPTDWQAFAASYPQKAPQFAQELAQMDPEVRKFAGTMRQWFDEMLNAERASGLQASKLEDFVQYMRRQSSLNSSDGLAQGTAGGIVPAMPRPCAYMDDRSPCSVS